MLLYFTIIPQCPSHVLWDSRQQIYFLTGVEDAEMVCSVLLYVQCITAFMARCNYLPPCVWTAGRLRAWRIKMQGMYDTKRNTVGIPIYRCL